MKNKRSRNYISFIIFLLVSPQDDYFRAKIWYTIQCLANQEAYEGEEIKIENTGLDRGPQIWVGLPTLQKKVLAFTLPHWNIFLSKKCLLKPEWLIRKLKSPKPCADIMHNWVRYMDKGHTRALDRVLSHAMHVCAMFALRTSYSYADRCCSQGIRYANALHALMPVCTVYYNCTGLYSPHYEACWLFAYLFI